jgi:hypothetical protein
MYDSRLTGLPSIRYQVRYVEIRLEVPTFYLVDSTFWSAALDRYFFAEKLRKIRYHSK